MAKDSMAKASTPEPFSASKTSNWVARGGGLPDYIQHIAHDLVEKRGKTESEAIAMAIGIVKRWARGGGNVDAGTRAAASKAVAEWEALKAKNAVKGAAKGAKRLAEERVGVIAEAFDGKKAPPFEKGGGRGGDKGGWTGEHKGGGGSPFGKGSGKCPTCDEPISQHDLGGRLKKDKVEESRTSGFDDALSGARKAKALSSKEHQQRVNAAHSHKGGGAPEINWDKIRDTNDVTLPHPFPDHDQDGQPSPHPRLDQHVHGSRVVDAKGNRFLLMGHGSVQGSVILRDSKRRQFHADSGMRLKKA